MKKTLKAAVVVPSPKIAMSTKNMKIRKFDPDKDHPLIMFQPTHTAQVQMDSLSPDEIAKLKEWWQYVTDSLDGGRFTTRPGSGPYDPGQGEGYVWTWTFSGDIDVEDPENNIWGDDCE